MLHAKNKTGLVFFPAFDWAISPTHPEREERLLYTQDQVLEEGLLDIQGIVEFKPDPVTLNDIQRVHFCVPDVWSVTTESHFISAGGAKTIGMAVLDQQVEKGFALVRPPGHHAMRVVHGARGFCNVNIEAIMIEYLRQAYDIDKVAIVDTDCHHGDGTQDIYWHDPDTLFISIHQDGRTLYPGSGFLSELGGPTAYGYHRQHPPAAQYFGSRLSVCHRQHRSADSGGFQAGPDYQLRRAGQSLFRPDHQHEFFGSGLCRVDAPAQCRHCRARRRVFD